MKKLLLGSTALVGLLIAGTASAQQVTTKAPFTITLNGDVRYTAVYTSDDNTNDGVENGFDARIGLTAAAKAENGLEYGAYMRFRNNGADATYSDVKYIYLKGASWGEVRLGDQYGVNGLVTAPVASFVLGDVYTLGSNSMIAYGGAASGISSGSPQQFYFPSWMALDALTGIQYTTPVFAGFQGSIFYAPEYEWGRNLLRGINSGVTSSFAPYEDVLQLAVRYKNTFGGVGLDLSAGYATADQTIVNYGDYEIWHVGGTISYAGFTFGGHYQDLGESFQARSNGGHTDTTTWALGATYGMGPWLVGVTYAAANYDRPGTGRTNRDLDQSIWEVGGSYMLAPGLTLQGSVLWYDMENANAAAGNSGTTVAVRTRVQF